MTPLVIDLFAGRGGWSQAFRDRGWDVVTVDLMPEFGCTYTSDVATWRWDGRQPDVVLASPPCTEFARESMPWCKTGVTPDTALVRAAIAQIDRLQPTRGWVLENVRGSQPYIAPLLGPVRQIVGPFYLWGDFPPLGVRLAMRKKESYGSHQADLRAMVPYALSAAACAAFEYQSRFLEVA